MKRLYLWFKVMVVMVCQFPPAYTFWIFSTQGHPDASKVGPFPRQRGPDGSLRTDFDYGGIYSAVLTR
jgi:hypothetical protein